MNLPDIHSLILILGPLWGGNATTAVVIVSVITGAVMIIIFRYLSDQQAVKRAREQLQAQLLAVRLFQDQLAVVMHSYGRILRGTGRYLQVAFKPLIIMIIPITLMIIQLDRWLGFEPLQTQQPFLVKAQMLSPEQVDDVRLTVPAGLEETAPAVHIPQERQIVWRLMAQKDGTYPLDVVAAGQTFSKQVIISDSLARVSNLRSQSFWNRFLSSTEPRLPQSSVVQSIEINYPERSIGFLGWQWNWVVLFLVLSLITGFVLKVVLHIEI